MTTFNQTLLQSMLAGAVEKIEANQDLLTKLDSVAGDGDHGVSILRAIRAAANAAQKAIDDGDPLKKTLHGVGWAIMSEDCGSTGPLVGSFFMGLSQPVDAEELDAAACQAMFEAGLAQFTKSSKAELGGKTMMDALHPAVKAMEGSSDVPTLFAAAAKAAVKGAESTKEMVAKYGRARNLGEKTIGHVDAGATSISLIFTAMSEAI